MLFRSVIDNFLEQKHFDFLSKVDFGKMKPKAWENYANSVENGVVTNSSGHIPQDMLIDMEKAYNPKLMKILEELAPNLVKHVTHSDIILTAIGKDLMFHLHTDVKSKLLSTVVYITPEKNSGTLLYNTRIDAKHGTDEEEIEWKQNRAFIFSRTDTSWHNYKADGINPRVVLVYNLRTKNPNFKQKDEY